MDTLIDISQKRLSHRLGIPVYRWGVQSDLIRDVEGITYENHVKFPRRCTFGQPFLCCLALARERERERNREDRQRYLGCMGIKKNTKRRVMMNPVNVVQGYY